ncbi:MAG: 4Fe-4S binding protein [Deltaproteobacteria bacterium]|nr:4Fe-4S binding protein [Deltaproteobacteria bacterium]
MKVMRKIIEIDDELCDGCGQCVPSCAEGAIEVVDGKAQLVAEKYCDGLGACMGDCPNGALKIVEREAEDFDEEAVEEYLSSQKTEEPESVPMACGCPSSQIQTFVPASSGDKSVAGDARGRTPSTLAHWPVQINLVPPTAPFLKGADLLVAADCVPVSYPDFHRDFLKGKVVMVGCPKFDDVEGYIQKFTEIFKTAGIRTITAVVMEVPCCSGLPMIVKRALEASGKMIPMEQVVISTRGEVIDRKQLAA